MIKTRLRYCVFDPDRFGNDRYYFRKPGSKKIRIRERFADDRGNVTREFMAAYWAALSGLNAEKPKQGDSPARKRLIGWWINTFGQKSSSASILSRKRTSGVS